MKQQQISITNISLLALLIGLLLFGIARSSKAQQAVGINNSSPDASSILDITSTTQGILIPRMTTTQRDAIASPATGLLVFVSSDNNFYYHNGTTWELVNASGDNDWTADIHGDFFNTNSRFTIGTPPFLNPFGRLEIFETSNTDALFALTTGNRNAGYFQISNSSNSANALKVITNGIGNALEVTTTGGGNTGVFEINNSTSSGSVLDARTNGLGKAGYFEIDNAASVQPSLSAYTTGIGNALSVYSTGSGDVLSSYTNGSGSCISALTVGSGKAGHFEINNSSNSSDALKVETIGNGIAGNFIITKTGNSSDALRVATLGTGFAGNFIGGNVLIQGNGNKRLIIQSNTNNDATLDLINQGSGTDWRINSQGFSVLRFEKSTNDLSTSVGVLDLVGGTPNSLEPSIDLGVQLGSLNFRYNFVFAQSGVVHTSDKNFKKNIKELCYGLDAVMKMRPISFDWTNTEQEKSNLGFIAQEIEEIVPEVVVREKPKNKDGSTKPGEDIYGMKYSELIPVLVKAIQEQQIIIEKLESKNQELEKKVNEILEK